jgi:hypothetical protein
VLAALLFIIAILATGAAIFQIAARLGAFGLGVRDVAARNPHVASNIVLTAILWVAWVLSSRCVMRSAGSIF